jgi:hypothetical protein
MDEPANPGYSHPFFPSLAGPEALEKGDIRCALPGNPGAAGAFRLECTHAQNQKHHALSAPKRQPANKLPVAAKLFLK